MRSAFRSCVRGDGHRERVPARRHDAGRQADDRRVHDLVRGQRPPVEEGLVLVRPVDARDRILDLTGLAGIVVAIYGVSAYYLQQKMEAADAKAAKSPRADKKKAAAAKKAEAEPKAAAAAAKEADESA